MDIPFELLWLVLVGAYYLLTARRRKMAQERQEQVRAAQASGEEPPAPSPFEAFIQQLETAAREANGLPPVEKEEREPIEVPPTPEARPGGPMPASPMPVPTQRPVTGSSGREFRPVGSFEAEGRFEDARRPPHEVHGYGTQNPFSEEAFERLPRGLDITKHAHAPLAPRPKRRSQPPPRRRNRWRESLQTAQGAQDAFVLKEILGGPWRPRRARMGHD